MKVVSTEALTKLIQLVKSAFIKVDDTVETGEIELLDVVASKDLSNINASQSAKETIVGWGMPDSSSAVTVTTTVNGTFTCPKDGYLYLSCYGNTGSAFLAYQSSMATYRINVYCCFVPASGTGIQTVCFPVRKNEILTCSASTGYNRQASFIPCIGG